MQRPADKPGAGTVAGVLALPGRPALALLVLHLILGCASPGPPRPPTLGLLAPPDDLQALRVGEGVELRWSTPGQTTDNLDPKGTFTAEICRVDLVSLPARGAGARPCPTVLRLPVSPGASSTARDRLPPALTTGSPAPLQYRVRLLNDRGREAGWSRAAIAPSGPVPPSVEGLIAEATRDGVRLRWRPEPGGAQIVLERRAAPAGSANPAATAAAGKLSRGRDPLGASLAPKQPPLVRLEAVGPGSTDSGQTLDGGAVAGESYTYVAERVRLVKLGAERVEERSASTPPLSVRLLDVYPPAPPADLLAAASGPAGDGDISIDLSWSPNPEPDLLGYVVDRAEDGGPAAEAVWRRLTPRPVSIPGFRDKTVQRGRRYRYRVAAVDRMGNQGEPGQIVTEQAQP